MIFLKIITFSFNIFCSITSLLPLLKNFLKKMKISKKTAFFENVPFFPDLTTFWKMVFFLGDLGAERDILFFSKYFLVIIYYLHLLLSYWNVGIHLGSKKITFYLKWSQKDPFGIRTLFFTLNLCVFTHFFKKIVLLINIIFFTFLYF